MTESASDAPEPLKEPDSEETVRLPQPDHAWKLLELVNSWIRQADTKAAAALTGAGLVGGTLFNLVRGLTSLSIPIDIAAVACAAAAVAAAASAGTALLPRLKAPTRARTAARLEQVSPLYFRHIRAHHETPDAYRPVVRTLLADSAALADELAGQIWVNADIATRKHIWTNRAIVAFLVALGLLGILSVLVARA